jgi:4-carboxymuconolactone decarboxylase
MKDDRYARSIARLTEIDGAAGDAVIAGLADLAPDLGRYIVEFGFGDVYSRPGLDLQTRELATVAALTAMGNAQAQLKVHLAAALNVGPTVAEVVEVVIQMAFCTGFPASLNAVTTLRAVLAARHD